MNRSTSVQVLRALTYVGVYGGLLMPLVFIPTVIFPFVFSKLIAFQVLIGVTFPAYLLLAWMEPEMRPRGHRLYFAIFAYFVAIATSVAFAVDPYRAWWGNQERMNGLFTLLHFFAWLTMTTSLLKTWDDWKRLLNYQVVLSGFMAIVAILQRAIPNLLLFEVQGPRVGGLLDNPIYMGAYQIFNLFFLALLALHTKSRRLWLWYGMIAIVDIGAFINAQSRGALVGLTIGIITFFLFVGIFSKQKKVRFATAGALLALVAGYGTLFAMRDYLIETRSVLARFVDVKATVATRLNAWNIAWEGFKERPLTGWGFDNYHILFNLKYPAETLRFGAYETWFDRAHNTVMDVLSMTGLFGLITFIAVFAVLYHSLWRAFRAGWLDVRFAAVLAALPLAYFVQNLFVFDHPAGFSMSYLLFALVIAATTEGFMKNTPPATEGERHGFPLTFATLLYVAALVLVWRTSVIPFRASQFALMSNAAYGTQQGLAWAEEANKRWTPYLDEQTFLNSRNLVQALSTGVYEKLYQPQRWVDLTLALNAEHFARHPNDTHARFLYARFLQELSRVKPEYAAQSEQEYLRAMQSSPERQQVFYGLASLYLRFGKVEEAMNLYDKVIALDPELGEPIWIKGAILFADLQRPADGAPEVLRAVTVAYPYQLRNTQEAGLLVEAAVVRPKEEAMKAIEKTFSKEIAGEDDAFFVKAASRFEQSGMPEVRDKVLELAAVRRPDVHRAYSLFKETGAATTTIPVATPPAPSTTKPVATTTPSRGPRR